MGKPTTKELEMAIEKAVEMREHGEDEFHLAKSLLNENYRLKKLEHVMELAKRYLHSGGSSKEHSLLIKAIEEAELAQAGEMSTD